MTIDDVRAMSNAALTKNIAYYEQRRDQAEERDDWLRYDRCCHYLGLMECEQEYRFNLRAFEETDEENDHAH